MTSLLETSESNSPAEDVAMVIDALLELVGDDTHPASAWRLDAVDIRVSDDRCIATVLGRWGARDGAGSVRQRRTISVFRRRGAGASWICSFAQVSPCSDAAGAGAQVR